jgi:pyruvate/2-oxoglutarate dehydrogenase complex dihydrolipoamide acyltransferase (E2) component
MPDENPTPDPETAPATPSPPAKRSRSRAKPKAAEAPAPAPAPETKPADDEPRAPKRATLAAERSRLLKLRRTLDRRRPIFGRTAANRYYRIGRDGAWRRPRGLQSKRTRAASASACSTRS